MTGTGAKVPPGVMKVYGSKISYYTGKLETYLRYSDLPYESFSLVGHRKTAIEMTGVAQMPVVQLGDGRWMTDTTPMLAWLDAPHGEHGIYPSDPVLNFAALLIEDYADEWLWRSAMHFRWTYRLSRQYAAEFLYQEQVRGKLPLPHPVGVAYLKRRQRGGFVRGDGVNSAETRAHSDATYLAALDRMSDILAIRPFLLGQTPTIADFAMMAPMLRHFSQDPTPAEIMRERAPAVYEWVARMWNAKPAPNGPALIEAVDAPLADFLKEICETHLAQLRQNALAISGGQKRYDQTIQGCTYRRVPSSRYRVWCLEVLRRRWSKLEEGHKAALQTHLTSPDAAILWDGSDVPASHYDVDLHAPFNRAINVFGNGTPPR